MPGPGGTMTADQAAEDLLGQVRDLRQEGAPARAVLRALEAEGFEPHTAQAVLHELPGPVQAEERDVVCGLDVSPMRAFLRGRAPDAQGVDEARATDLVTALTRHGLSAATASGLVAETVSQLRRSADVHSRRLRKVAVQGMAAGGVFTLFFAWSALRANYDGRVDAVTAGMTLLLTGYSWLLYRRHRSQ